MKLLVNISLLSLLMTSCSMFSETPPKIIEGQRAVYQGLLLAEENDIEILKRYEEDNKAAISYHINYIYELKINEIRLASELLYPIAEDKLQAIAALEAERDQQIQDVFIDIDANVQEMRDKSGQNLRLTMKLTETVYSYLSTSPMSIDNVDFWIEKLKK